MAKRTRDLIISIDGETNGPCPLVNSLWQFGAAFYDHDGNEIDSYEVNLKEVEGTTADASTLAWWTEQDTKNPGLLNKIRSNQVDPAIAMNRFSDKVVKYQNQLDAKPLIVAYPAGFDFTWLYVYLHKFVGKSVVGFSALDMKTMAMTLLQTSYHDSAKKRFPKEWFDPTKKHTHMALDDAREQGYTYFQMRKAMQENWSIINADGMRTSDDLLNAN